MYDFQCPSPLTLTTHNVQVEPEEVRHLQISSNDIPDEPITPSESIAEPGPAGTGHDSPMPPGVPPLFLLGEFTTQIALCPHGSLDHPTVGFLEKTRADCLISKVL